MHGYTFDPDLVDAFVEGKLDPRGEVELADQVARVIPYHWAGPNPMVVALEKLRRHLGGDAGLFAWLERHPGRPRVVAGLYTVIGLLDRVSDNPGVVTALRELRERTPDPPELREYLVPHTDEETLASLSGSIEALLGDELDRAVSVATAALGMLRQIAPHVGELDPDARDLGALVERATRDLTDAASGHQEGADGAANGGTVAPGGGP